MLVITPGLSEEGKKKKKKSCVAGVTGFTFIQSRSSQRRAVWANPQRDPRR